MYEAKLYGLTFCIFVNGEKVSETMSNIEFVQAIL